MSGALPDPGRRLRRRPWRSVELVALDFEATGLDLQKDTIVSFGTVPIRGGRIDVGDAVYQLVDPGDVAVSPRSITVHGLRSVDLEGAPPLEAARQALGEQIAGRMVVAWWAPVEAAFLDKLFGGGSGAWRHRMVDVRDMLLALEGASVAGHTLTEVADRYDVPVASPHNALDDALVAAQLFLALAPKVGPPSMSVRDLQRLKPARLQPSSALG